MVIFNSYVSLPEGIYRPLQIAENHHFLQILFFGKPNLLEKHRFFHYRWLIFQIKPGMELDELVIWMMHHNIP